VGSFTMQQMDGRAPVCSLACHSRLVIEQATFAEIVGHPGRFNTLRRLSLHNETLCRSLDVIA